MITEGSVCSHPPPRWGHKKQRKQKKRSIRSTSAFSSPRFSSCHGRLAPVPTQALCNSLAGTKYAYRTYCGGNTVIRTKHERLNIHTGRYTCLFFSGTFVGSEYYSTYIPPLYSWGETHSSIPPLILVFFGETYSSITPLYSSGKHTEVSIVRTKYGAVSTIRGYTFFGGAKWVLVPHNS